MINTQTSTAERLANLKARATETRTPSNWRPEPNTTLTGIIKGTNKFIHAMYGQQHTLLVEDENGQLISVYLNDYLSRGLKQNQAEAGDLIAITFHGKRDNPKTGGKFNAYTLLVDKA